ncbi:hypothetical protein BLNAU_9878 [Blattamonas nauphoetae]|uniref:Uncharacterized protein n=1 Tax=Blattamonas nauphoetae TaxID=2049346 RepID=A0ABQ9XUJ6_9EUKA|nr:hypothetical protein BLNAU_9878 [Blattamonas nauphoetae]
MNNTILVLNVSNDVELSFDEKSTIYDSLVALVKAEYPFNNALQDRAAQFLKNLEPKRNEQVADKLITDLVPSSAGSPSGFVESILTLLSSPHSTVVAAVLSFLFETTRAVFPPIRCHLAASNLVSNVLATVQPHALSISGNEAILFYLIEIVIKSVHLAFPSSLQKLNITDAVDAFNHREMIFQKVVLPSDQFVTFLITNRHILDEDLLGNFMELLNTFIQIGSFHRPTLEFVIASPIVMTFSRCLSLVENDYYILVPLMTINKLLKEWNEEDPEVSQSVKRIVHALFSEGFEDTLEQMMKFANDDYICNKIVDKIHSISRFLGSNVKKP